MGYRSGLGGRVQEQWGRWGAVSCQEGKCTKVIGVWALGMRRIGGRRNGGRGREED